MKNNFKSICGRLFPKAWRQKGLHEKKKDGGVGEMPDGRTDGQTDDRIDARTDSRTDLETDFQTDDEIDIWLNIWTDGQVDIETDGQVDIETDGQADIETDGQTDDQMDGWSDDLLDGQTDGQTDNRTDGQMDGRTDSQMDGRTDSQTDGRTDSQTDGGTDIQTDVQTDGRTEHLPEYLSNEGAQTLGGKPGRKRKFLKRTIVLVSALVAVVVLTTVFVFAYFYRKSNFVKDEDISRYTLEDIREAAASATESQDVKNLERIANEEDILSEDERELLREQLYAVKLPENKDIYNILLIGEDRRHQKWHGNSDAMMVISIDSSNKVIHLTSFMRDLYAIVPGYGGRKLNSAYGLGGGPLLVETIEENWKLPIDNYASVDFAAMIHVVDVLGGVDLDIDKEERLYANRYVKSLCKMMEVEYKDHRIKKAGRVHCDGYQALGYMRIRAIGYDYARTQRQRNVIQAIMTKLKKVNVTQMMALADTILPYVTHNLDEGRVLSLLTSAPAILTYDVVESRVPYQNLYRSINQNLFCDFTATIEKLHEEIYSFKPKRRYVKPPYPRSYHGILEESEPAV